MAPCHGLNCTHGCKPTGKGPACFCPEGMQPHKNECIGTIFFYNWLLFFDLVVQLNYFVLDMDECEVLDYTCDQICTNKKGSFSCGCVSGYVKKNSTCEAINGN